MSSCLSCSIGVLERVELARVLERDRDRRHQALAAERRAHDVDVAPDLRLERRAVRRSNTPTTSAGRFFFSSKRWPSRRPLILAEQALADDDLVGAGLGRPPADQSHLGPQLHHVVGDAAQTCTFETCAALPAFDSASTTMSSPAPSGVPSRACFTPGLAQRERDVASDRCCSTARRPRPCAGSWPCPRCPSLPIVCLMPRASICDAASTNTTSAMPSAVAIGRRLANDQAAEVVAERDHGSPRSPDAPQRVDHVELAKRGTQGCPRRPPRTARPATSAMIADASGRAGSTGRSSTCSLRGTCRCPG